MKQPGPNVKRIIRNFTLEKVVVISPNFFALPTKLKIFQNLIQYVLLFILKVTLICDNLSSPIKFAWILTFDKRNLSNG